jgi:hypothetical protein
MQKIVVEWLLFLVGLLVTLGMPWLIWRRLRAGRPSEAPRPIVDDGSGGKVIPLVAAFRGVRGLSWIGVANNNLNPMLVITPVGITYRVMRRRTRVWSDIEQVDVLTLGATVNLRFEFHGSLFTFDANLGSTILATQALALLERHVAMTDRARALLPTGT